MAGITFNAWTGRVVITGSPQNNAALVRQVGGQIEAQLQSGGGPVQTKYFAAQAVSGVDFFGGAANDTFLNLTAKPVVAYGGAGNDVLVGGTGNDALYGDGGSDLIDGSAGNDRLYGGAAHDIVLGNFGNDQLSGGDGNDFLHGGDGNDAIAGDTGDDVLVGGSGLDNLTDYFGNNTFYDSAMWWGSYLGYYQGNGTSRYFEGQCLGNNLTSTDLMLRYKNRVTYSGYGNVVDQLMRSGYSTVEQNLLLVNSVSTSPATTMLRDTINQVWPT